MLILTQLSPKMISLTANQQVCCRCGKTFLRRPNGKYITKEQCVHHWGKLWTKRGNAFQNTPSLSWSQKYIYIYRYT